MIEPKGLTLFYILMENGSLLTTQLLTIHSVIVSHSVTLFVKYSEP